MKSGEGLSVRFFPFRELTPGTPCADPRTLVRQRLVFWIVSVLLLGLLAVPWLAPLFY